MSNPARFRDFIARFSAVVDRHGSDEAKVFAAGAPLLADLVRHDDWLPPEFAQDSPESYRQYLLYCDPRERFSVVSFVWGPGQRTPVHDHTVWGMVGVLRGAEMCEEYAPPRSGEPMRKTEPAAKQFRELVLAPRTPGSPLLGTGGPLTIVNSASPGEGATAPDASTLGSPTPGDAGSPSIDHSAPPGEGAATPDSSAKAPQ